MATTITAAATVRQHLAEARSRAEPFPEAWQDATSGLPFAWQTALAETRQHWYRAYVGRPPACGQAAFSTLAETRAA